MKKNLFLLVLAMLMAVPMMAAEQTVKLDGFRIGTSTTVKYTDYYGKKESTVVNKKKKTNPYWSRYRLNLPELKSGNVYLLSDAKTLKQTLILENANLSEASINFISKDLTIVVNGNCQLKQIIANESGFKGQVTVTGGKLSDDTTGWAYVEGGGKLTMNYSSNGIGPLYVNGDKGNLYLEGINLVLNTTGDAIHAMDMTINNCNITGNYKTLFSHWALIKFNRCGINASAYPNLHYSLKDRAFMNNGKEVKVEISRTQYERISGGGLFLSNNNTSKVSIKNKAGEVCYEYLKIGSKDLAKVNLGDMRLFGDSQFYSYGTEQVTVGVGKKFSAQKLIIPYKMLKSGDIYYIPSQKALYFSGVNINGTLADVKRELFNTCLSVVFGKDVKAYFYRVNTITFNENVFFGDNCNLMNCVGSSSQLNATSTNSNTIFANNLNMSVPGTLKTTSAGKSAVSGNGTFTVDKQSNITLQATNTSAIGRFANIRTIDCGIRSTKEEGKNIKYDKTAGSWLKNGAPMKLIEIVSPRADHYKVDTRTNTKTENGHTIWPLTNGTFVKEVNIAM